MIQSFKCNDTRKLFETGKSKRFTNIKAVAKRKLDYLDAAEDIIDLRIPPGNRLAKLSGDRMGQWSIRINDQWRICFIWDANDAYDAEIVDYH